MHSKALEFFSGIGAFKLLANEFNIDVLAAFDQSDDANTVYLHNFNECPRQRNLDTIPADEIPAADFWWLSPPCKPFSRRGKKADLDDPRARAFINLVNLLALKLPCYFALENVQGFAGSRAESLLLRRLKQHEYYVRKISICPTHFGVPMQRPRLFYLASRAGPIGEFATVASPLQAITDFIDPKNDLNLALRLDPLQQKRYAESLNIISVNERQAKAICFTSGYSRSMKSSGSLIALANGDLRYFSPEEILALLGFPARFEFPDHMSLACRYRLAGNSIDLRSIRLALNLLLRS